MKWVIRKYVNIIIFYISQYHVAGLKPVVAQEHKRVTVNAGSGFPLDEMKYFMFSFLRFGVDVKAARRR